MLCAPHHVLLASEYGRPSAPPPSCSAAPNLPSSFDTIAQTGKAPLVELSCVPSAREISISPSSSISLSQHPQIDAVAPKRVSCLSHPLLQSPQSIHPIPSFIRSHPPIRRQRQWLVIASRRELVISGLLTSPQNAHQPYNNGPRGHRANSSITFDQEDPQR